MRYLKAIMIVKAIQAVTKKAPGAPGPLYAFTGINHDRCDPAADCSAGLRNHEGEDCFVQLVIWPFLCDEWRVRHGWLPYGKETPEAEIREAVETACISAVK